MLQANVKQSTKGINFCAQLLVPGILYTWKHIALAWVLADTSVASSTLLLSTLLYCTMACLLSLVFRRGVAREKYDTCTMLSLSETKQESASFGVRGFPPSFPYVRLSVVQVGGYLAFIGLFCLEAALGLSSGKDIRGVDTWGLLLNTRYCIFVLFTLFLYSHVSRSPQVFCVVSA